MKCALFLFSSFALLTIHSLAQSSTADWTAVEGLRSGTRVIVYVKDGSEIKGKITRAMPTALDLQRNGRSVSLQRGDVQRVYLTRRGPVLKRALIGAAAGAGIGILVGAVAVAATKSDGLAAAGGFLYGIPVGVAVGAATTRRRRGVLIYSSQ